MLITALTASAVAAFGGVTRLKAFGFCCFAGAQVLEYDTNRPFITSAVRVCWPRAKRGGIHRTTTMMIHVERRRLGRPIYTSQVQHIYPGPDKYAGLGR